MLLYWGVLCCVLFGGLFLAQRFDNDDWSIGKKEGTFLLGICGGSGILIGLLQTIKGIDGVLFAVLTGCLLFACVTDCRTCEVFQFTWWLAGAAGGLLLCRNMIRQSGDGMSEKEILFLFLVYAMLQELFFCRMYGRADCHAFVCCALAGCAYGIGFVGYLCQMAMAFGFLGIVQAFRHNINRRGNLKQPVAFLPYITVSFWVLLLGYQWCV